MMKVLAYCAFLDRAGISVPEHGVGGAPVRETGRDQVDNALRLLWSEVEWPFADSSLQRSAVEFHQVVSHLFAQTAVVPFRLLSLFEDSRALRDFLAAHREGLIADLQRLDNVVQMECVLYPAPAPAQGASGREYLEQKAAALHRAEGFIENVNAALGPLGKDVHVRESKKAIRIFVLVERGQEQEFHSIVRQLPVPERLARRTSGPWPPAEFLSDSVKMPR